MIEAKPVVSGRIDTPLTVRDETAPAAGSADIVMRSTSADTLAAYCQPPPGAPGSGAAVALNVGVNEVTLLTPSH
jgi:hypothetical protein